ncbi:hypothetical protein ACIBQ6_21345 [Nonomuraea sp. NPDC049655]|uniref:hypothetical protein n=1 Tax=Nonomuraea sp. NPDC049655 TaxID=3364355 RepID=UPI0037AEF9F6
MMALSRLAREFAAEISNHDWRDAPYRLDRAGHQWELDSPGKRSDTLLSQREARFVKTNVMWVAAQVLGHEDPNFDIKEFAEACGLTGMSESTLYYGTRRNSEGRYSKPGSYE